MAVKLFEDKWYLVDFSGIYATGP